MKNSEKLKWDKINSIKDEGEKSVTIFMDTVENSELHFIDIDCLDKALTPEQFKKAAESIVDMNGFQPDYSHELLDSLMERQLELLGYDVSPIRKSPRYYYDPENNAVVFSQFNERK